MFFKNISKIETLPSFLFLWNSILVSDKIVYGLKLSWPLIQWWNYWLKKNFFYPRTEATMPTWSNWRACLLKAAQYQCVLMPCHSWSHR